VQNIQRTATTSFTGANASQVTNFSVQNIAPGTSRVLSGTIDRAADTARLIYTGTADGRVVNTAVFDVTGQLGFASISITRDELLSNVAARINAASDDTGVTASVAGDQLIFESVGVGAAEEISVELTNVEQIVSTSGVNGSQLTAFQVNSVAANSTQNISGTITRNASQAQLTYAGEVSNRIGAAATFTLTGSVGSAVISVTFLQSLTSARDAINAKTGETGVVAAVESGDLVLRSSGVGSAATIGINVTSGTFAVSGGNGNGTANGLDALATINGQSLTGVANSFTFADAGGSYSFTAAASFLGAISTVTVTSAAGEFDLSGGNGDGTANGVDAQATINGQTITGAGNDFSLTVGGDQFSFSATPGFAGALDPITVESTLATFDLSGGNGDGTAAGADAAAVINGQQVASGTRRFAFADATGSYEIEFAEGFFGAFDAITVTPLGGTFALEGGAATGEQFGVDAQATLNGEEVTASGNRFVVNGAGVTATLEVVDNFVGQLAPISIRSQPVEANAAELDAARASLNRLAEYRLRLGEFDESEAALLANVGKSFATATLFDSLQQGSERAAASTASSTEPPTRLSIISQTFRQLVVRDPRLAEAGRLLQADQRRRLVVDLLA